MAKDMRLACTVSHHFDPATMMRFRPEADFDQNLIKGVT
jgi:hypothetical protein